MSLPQPAVAGVIGWPVAHSLSPIIHRFWLNKLQADGDYSRFPVHPDRLAGAVKALPALGVRGVNVTVPHKEKVMVQMDYLAPSASGVGAVNTVVVTQEGKLYGHNTDVDGIEDALQGHDIAGNKVCLIGAGGAARAAMQVFRNANAASVSIIARTPARGRELLADFGMRGTIFSFDETAEALQGGKLVVNASPMGMHGQAQFDEALLQNLSLMDKTALAFDMVYAPLETAFLKAARKHGLRTAHGLSMLIGQAATAFTLFYGSAPPRNEDAALMDLLTR